MIHHTITGLVIDCIEAKCKHCQFSFLMFHAIIHQKIRIVNPNPMPNEMNGGLAAQTAMDALFFQIRTTWLCPNIGFLDIDSCIALFV